MNHAAAAVSLMVSRHVLKALEDQVPDIAQFLARLEKQDILKRFPDGSVFEQQGEAYQFGQVFSQQPSAGVLVAKTVHRSMAAFSQRYYSLLFPKAYDEALMPNAFVVGLQEMYAPKPSEHVLENLSLSVGFQRKPQGEVMEKYAGMVFDWCQSVRASGVFGDGPISPISSDIEFSGLRATFRVDARLSGQNTLNWFIISALNFGIEVWPINVVLPANEEFFENWFGPQKGDIIKIVFEPNPKFAQVRPRKKKKLAPLPETLPQDCVRYKKFTSSLLIYRRPILEWDALRICVYFTVFPTPGQRDNYAKLIQAWGTVGLWGGLGGIGIHKVGEIEFDESLPTAGVEVDLGDVDETALSILVKALEGFSRELPIEAVVLGRGK